MRILEQDSNSLLEKIIIYLTKDEAVELSNDLIALIKSPNYHSHISSNDYKNEITICIYNENELSEFNDVSKKITRNNERHEKNFMTSDELETIELRNILLILKKDLDAESIHEIEDYIDHREWGLAYETICVLIQDYNIKISNYFFEKIVNLGKRMDIEHIYIDMIKGLVSDL